MRVLGLILFNLSLSDLKVVGWSAVSASLQMIPNEEEFDTPNSCATIL